jgi:hypothetical protein
MIWQVWFVRDDAEIFPGYHAAATELPPGKLSEHAAQVMLPRQRSEAAHGREKILSLYETTSPNDPLSHAFWSIWHFCVFHR